MTNTIFFNLDNASYSTSSPDSTLSQQQQQQVQEGSEVNVEASLSYSTSATVAAAADAINVWISRLNLEEEEASNSGNDQNFLSNSVPQSPMLKNFMFKQLKIATRNFHSDSLLEEGGFERMFKGWIDENTLSATKPGTGTAVAVKRLNPEGFQGHKEWLTEINHLGILYHLNLVRLLGYCLHKKERLLVYEFMPRGSLDNHLFRRASNCQLSWSIRLKIALETAKALAYLHSGEINVIHRNLKPSNILLDSNFNAKLSDFGIARDGPTGDMTYISTRVMGTYGYIAPEDMGTGHLTAKSDVYSFGVVLLEILSGRRAIDMSLSSREQDLLEWAMPYLKNKQKIFHILDSHLEGQYSLKNAQKAADLALQCISMKPTLRPNMDVVVTTLEQLLDSIKNPFL